MSLLGLGLESPMQKRLTRDETRNLSLEKQQKELERIFAIYSGIGGAPSHSISDAKFLRMMRDAQILDDNISATYCIDVFRQIARENMGVDLPFADFRKVRGSRGRLPPTCFYPATTVS